MITRRDALRLAALAALASPLLAACGADQPGKKGGGSTVAGRIEFVSGDAERLPGDPGAIPDVVSALHRFAGGLYGALPAGDNLVLSPYSVAVALGMALSGAGGTTAREMRDVLGADDRYPAGLNALTAHVEGLAATEKRADGSSADIALAAANQLFGQAGVGWETPFLDLLAEQYGAGLRTVDFENATEDARLLINDWVAGRTHDRIEDLIPAGVLDVLTRLVIVNAIYLKAPWEVPFTKELTTKAPFHLADGGTVDVDLMRGEASRGRRAHGDGWQTATIPYAGGRLAMTVVLPDEGRLADVETLVAGGALPGMLAEGRTTGLAVSLPRWTARTAASLKEALGGLGMRAAFDPERADFRPMTEDDLDLYVSAVLHQGFIAVDEDGTEAAAATAVVIRETSAMLAEPFVVDRPFLYVIHDVEHGTPLFLGRVVDPSCRRRPARLSRPGRRRGTGQVSRRRRQPPWCPCTCSPRSRTGSRSSQGPAATSSRT